MLHGDVATHVAESVEAHRRRPEPLAAALDGQALICGHPPEAAVELQAVFTLEDRDVNRWEGFSLRLAHIEDGPHAEASSADDPSSIAD